MSEQLIIGILANTIIFGIMAFRNQKLGIRTPDFLQSKIFGMPLIIADFASFAVILLSPDEWWIKILTALLMQFLINHIFWGIITGVIASRAPTTETLVDSEEDPILEYIKTLNPSEFPRVTALSNQEQLQIREVMNTVNKSFKKVYEVDDFKDFLVIYEKVLEKKANGEYKELLEEIHKSK